MRVLILIGIICVVGIFGDDSQYCEKELCRGTCFIWGFFCKDHIACPGIAKNNCPKDVRDIIVDDQMKQFILDKHNSYRNILAGGNLKDFPTAKFMGTMQWNDELAYVASKNAKQCIFAHDECRNTKKFPNSGQNIGMSQFLKTDKIAIETFIDGWWNEYKDCSKNVLLSIRKTDPQTAHFLQMAVDRAIYVGCAGVYFGRKTHIFTCNYSYNLQGDKKTYTTGSIASGCNTGTNPSYPNLCSTKEFFEMDPE